MVFAHIEAKKPVGRAEQELRQRLGKFGLARAGRPREKKDADGLAGIVEPRLQHRDPVDHGGDRLVLAHDARREIFADRGEIGALLAVEDRSRDAGRLRQAHDHIMRRHGPVRAFHGARNRRLQEIERGAGKAGGAQILPGRSQSGFRAGGIDFKIGFGGQTPCHGMRKRERFLLRKRLEADQLEHIAQLRAQPQKTRGSRGRGFGPHDEAS